MTTTLTVELDEEAMGRLRSRARHEGLDPAALAVRLLAEATAEPDPFDFVGSFASDGVTARTADTYLEQHGFGRS